jgi:hypothetical protein
MVPGSLHTGADAVHVESWQSIDCGSLVAYICLSCGRIELQASNLECLARHDIADEDLDQLRRGEKR